MNFSSLLSFLGAFAVLGIGLYSASDNPFVFVDGVSAFIVIGGTVAAAAISFRLSELFGLIKVFLSRVMSGRNVGYKETIYALMEISKHLNDNPEKAKEAAQKSKNYFLMEAVDLAAENILKQNDLTRILRSRVESMYQHYSIDANKFKSLGKFPPAFGMMGTTIGMIVLLANLGGSDAVKSIGPSMAICLITTLYGVAFANLIIIPIAENLTVNSKEIKLKNTIIAEGIRMILDGKKSVLLVEELNSFLLPHDRVDWKEVLN